MIRRWIPFLALLGIIGAVWIGFSEPINAQSQTAQDVCIHRWEWIAPLGEEPFWQAPFAQNLTGLIDLRSIPQMSLAGGIPEGWGLFVYDKPMGSTGMHCLGNDLDVELSIPQVDTLALILGKKAGDFRASNMRGLLKELLTQEADPTGQSFWKPVRISKRAGFRIVLGGYGTIVQEPFSESHPAFQPTLDVRWADYRRNKAEGLALETLQKWNDYDAIALFGRTYTQSDLDKLIPTEFRDDGTRPHTTTVADTFNRANNTDLNAADTGKTLDGEAASWTWTEEVGDAQISSNALRGVAQGANANTYDRSEQDLSSDAMHVTMTVVNIDGATTVQQAGLLARWENPGLDNYLRYRVLAGATFRHLLTKTVGGTGTVLGEDDSAVPSRPFTLELIVDGSDLITSIAGGTTIFEVTDGDVSGFFRSGIYMRHGTSSSSESIVDNFEAADLAAAAPRRIIIID